MQIKKYLRGDGRASRTEYWVTCLTTLVAAVIVSLIASEIIVDIYILMDSVGVDVAEYAVPGIVLKLLVSLLLNAGWLWVLVAVSVRRLHDCNIPGWPALILFVPLFGICFLITLGVLPPNKSERYGADPRLARRGAQPSR